MQFTENYIIWGMDSDDMTQPPYICRYNRHTGNIEQMQIAAAPFYWSWKTAKGELLFATTPEEAGTVDSAVNIFYSNDEGATWNIIYSMRFVGRYWFYLRFLGEYQNKICFVQTTIDSSTISYIAEIVEQGVQSLDRFALPLRTDSNNYLIFGSSHAKTTFVRNSTNMYELNAGGLESLIAGNGLIVKSPDGTRYKISVADGGTLAITAL
jgi:hypothetical protein